MGLSDIPTLSSLGETVRRILGPTHSPTTDEAAAWGVYLHLATDQVRLDAGEEGEPMPLRMFPL